MGYWGSGQATTLNALVTVLAVTLSFLILGEEPGLIEWIGLLGVIHGISGAICFQPIKTSQRQGINEDLMCAVV